NQQDVVSPYAVRLQDDVGAPVAVEIAGNGSALTAIPRVVAHPIQVVDVGGGLKSTAAVGDERVGVIGQAAGLKQEVGLSVAIEISRDQLVVVRAPLSLAHSVRDRDVDDGFEASLAIGLERQRAVRRALALEQQIHAAIAIEISRID